MQVHENLLFFAPPPFLIICREKVGVWIHLHIHIIINILYGEEKRKKERDEVKEGKGKRRKEQMEETNQYILSHLST